MSMYDSSIHAAGEIVMILKLVEDSAKPMH